MRTCFHYTTALGTHNSHTFEHFISIIKFKLHAAHEFGILDQQKSKLGRGGDCFVAAQRPDTRGLSLCIICNLLLYQSDQTNRVAFCFSFETNATRAAYVCDLPMSILLLAKHKPSPLPYRPGGIYPRLQVVYRCFVTIPRIRCDWIPNRE